MKMLTLSFGFNVLLQTLYPDCVGFSVIPGSHHDVEDCSSE